MTFDNQYDRRPIEIVNAGQRLLVETGASLNAIAAACNRTKSQAKRYKIGQDTPSPEAREKLYDAYGIPYRSWDERAPRSEGAAMPLSRSGASPSPRDREVLCEKPIANHAESLGPPNPYNATPLDAVAFDDGPEATTTEQLREMMLEGLRELHSGNLTDSLRSKARGATMRTVAVLARLERDCELESSAAVENHPAFKALLSTVFRAVEPYPEASRALRNALASVESNG